MNILKKAAAISILFFFSFFLTCEVIIAQEYSSPKVTVSESSAVSTVSRQEADQGLKDAEILFKRGKMDAAIFMLQELEKKDPTNFKVLFKLGEMAIASKNWAYAIEVLRKASFAQPSDITVRLILMDVYKAHQMPIQEIIVGKEILALEPKNEVALQRLAKIYKGQEMYDDELTVREKLLMLTPDDYPNTKRLATLFETHKSDPREAIKIYELIRKHHPSKKEDLTRLAAMYDDLEENYRELAVIEDLEKMGEKRPWLKNRALERIRQENSILFYPLEASTLYSKSRMAEMDVNSSISEVTFTHIPPTSSYNFGLAVGYSQLTHKGSGVLAGTMDIDSFSVAAKYFRAWSGQKYSLRAKLGVLDDEVSDSLSASAGSGVTSQDYPFLADPSFNSYGGSMPIGAIEFNNQTNPTSSYRATYEHKLVEDLDARLKLFYANQVTFGWNATVKNDFEFDVEVSESAISDNNLRFHGLAGASYTFWKKISTVDSSGKTKQQPNADPVCFLKGGYAIEYYTDDDSSIYYETFTDEFRHQANLSGRSLLYDVATDQHIFIDAELGYAGGTTLNYRRHADIGLTYQNDKTANEIVLLYSYEKDDVESSSTQNDGIGGESESSSISLNLRWRF